MATARVTHKINRLAVARLLTGPAVGNNMFARGLRVEARAKVEISQNPKRVDSGRLRSSIQTARVRRNNLPGARVGSNVKYALWVHQGTGIYGPRRTKIVPRSRKALRFIPKGQTGYVFARSVRGMRPNHYLTNALPAARL